MLSISELEIQIAHQVWELLENGHTLRVGKCRARWTNEWNVLVFLLTVLDQIDHRLSKSWVFKVVSLSLNAPGLVPVHCGCPLMLRNLAQMIIQCVHELLSVWKEFTPHKFLQFRKQPEIQRIQVRTVGGLGYLWQVHWGIVKPGLHWETPVGRSPIMKQSPMSGSPHLWASAAHSISEILQNLEIQSTIDPLPLGHKTPVYQALPIKKDHQHHFLDWLLMHRHCRRCGVSGQPLSVVPSGCRIPAVKPRLISTHNVIHRPIPSKHPQCSPCPVDTPLTLLGGEAMRYPMRTLLLQQKVFFQCSVCTSKAQVTPGCYLSDCLPSVLSHNGIHMLNLGCSAAQWLSGAWQISSLNPPSRKGSKPATHLRDRQGICTMHLDNPTHCFSLCEATLDTKFYLHSLINFWLGHDVRVTLRQLPHRQFDLCNKHRFLWDAQPWVTSRRPHNMRHPTWMRSWKKNLEIKNLKSSFSCLRKIKWTSYVWRKNNGIIFTCNDAAACQFFLLLLCGKAMNVCQPQHITIEETERLQQVLTFHQLSKYADTLKREGPHLLLRRWTHAVRFHF